MGGYQSVTRATNRRRWAVRHFAGLLVVFAAFLAVRCSDANNRSAAQTPTEPAPAETAPPLPTLVPTPSPTPSPVPTAPAAGNPALNAIATAVGDGDAATLSARIKPLELPCTSLPGSGSLPPCPKGTREGTLQAAFPVVGCTGRYIDAPAAGALLANLKLTFRSLINLPASSDSRFPTGGRGLVFESTVASGLVLSATEDGQIISLHTPCNQGLGALVTSLQAGSSYSALWLLQETLSKEIATTQVDGVYAISVLDLQTGMVTGVGDLDPMPSGCVLNLLVIIEVLRQVEAGHIPFSEVDATIRQTIYYSDAEAAYTLYQRAGGGDSDRGVLAVARLLEELGMSQSNIDHPPAYSEGEANFFVPNLVTAADMNRALQQLYRGEILNEELTDYLLGAMTDVKPGLNYLTAALPDEALVSHKNGFFFNDIGWVDNDTAIVRFGPDLEYAYAITFLSDEVEELYSEIWMAQRMVAEAWYHFRDTYTGQ